jgi:hypothetical protein
LSVLTSGAETKHTDLSSYSTQNVTHQKGYGGKEIIIFLISINCLLAELELKIKSC